MTQPAPLRRGFFAQLPEELIAELPGVPRVYAWLDRRAGARGWWHDSNRALAEAMGLDHRTVDRALDQLQARGLVATARPAYRVTCYQLPARGMIIGASTPRCDHQIGASHAPILGRPTPRSAIYTSLDRKSPQKSPYKSDRGVNAPIAAQPSQLRLPDLEAYRAVVHRSWPATASEQGGVRGASLE